eukprot:781842-Rhodomonas_salina.4
MAAFEAGNLWECGSASTNVSGTTNVSGAPWFVMHQLLLAKLSRSTGDIPLATEDLTGQFGEMSRMVAALNEEKNSLIAQLRQPRAIRRAQQTSEF